MEMVGELNPEPGRPTSWGEYRVSSHCTNGGCVEVAFGPSGMVAVRDGKRPDQPSHLFTSAEWRAFVAGVKAGEFDR